MPQVYSAPTTFKEAAPYVCESIAQLRQQLPPTFTGATAGPTTYPIVFLLGGATPFGGNAAIYAWDPTSAAADNNSTVIKPDNAQVGGNPGRWRMLGGVL